MCDYTLEMRLILPIVLLVACTPDDDEKKGVKDTNDRTVAGDTDTDDTDTDGDTDSDPTGPTTDYDCTLPFPQPPFQVNSHDIQTQEDFDFATGGYLVYQYGVAVVGTTVQGVNTVLSPGAAGDPRGVHGLADGRIVIMSPWDGSIKIANPATNGLDVLAGGLNTPNGVEVDLNDRIYFTSYGEVGWTEPDGSDKQVIADWGQGFTQANGIALSPDEQLLTVAVPTLSNTEFVTIERLGPDDWGNVQTLHDVPGFFSTLDTDVCGNVYTVDYNSGDLWRILTDGTAEQLGSLNGQGIWGFSAMRFGPGQGGWERDRLYVTKRNTEVFEIDIGIPGRRHPTTP